MSAERILDKPFKTNLPLMNNGSSLLTYMETHQSRNDLTFTLAIFCWARRVHAKPQCSLGIDPSSIDSEAGLAHAVERDVAWIIEPGTARRWFVEIELSPLSPRQAPFVMKLGVRSGLPALDDS